MRRRFHGNLERLLWSGGPQTIEGFRPRCLG
jgi:hypothetical protein